MDLQKLGLAVSLFLILAGSVFAQDKEAKMQDNEKIKQQIAAEIQQNIIEGNQQYKEGSYTQAIGAYEKVLDRDFNSAAAWRKMGDAYDKLHQYPQAIACHEKAVSLNPYDIKTYIGLVMEYKVFGKPKDLKEDVYGGSQKIFMNNKVIEYSQKIIEIKPDDPSAYMMLAIGYMNVGKTQEMVDTFLKGKNICVKRGFTQAAQFMDNYAKQATMTQQNVSADSPEYKAVEAEIARLGVSQDVQKELYADMVGAMGENE